MNSEICNTLINPKSKSFVPLCPPLSSTERFVLLSILSMAFKPLSSTKNPILFILLMWAKTLLTESS